MPAKSKSIDFPIAIAILMAIIPWCLTTSILKAQSNSDRGTRSSLRPDLGQQQAELGNKIPAHFAEAELAMQGYCPVSIIDDKKWIKGDEQYSVILDGHKYLLASQANQQKFLKRSTKYTPALSGDCVVTYAAMKTRQAGDLNAAAIHQGRLFLFASPEQKRIFMTAPKKFENVDLALNGSCCVCLVDRQERVPGKIDFGTVAGGLRFYFSDAQHRKQFLSDKARYVEPAFQASLNSPAIP